jgi:hypothetical protein
MRDEMTIRGTGDCCDDMTAETTSGRRGYSWRMAAGGRLLGQRLLGQRLLGQRLLRCAMHQAL